MIKRTLFYFLLFCTLATVTGGLILANGIQLGTVAFSSVTIEGVSLKWAGKLKLDVEKVLVTPSLQSDKEKGGSVSGKYALPALRWMKRLFSHVAIETLVAGELQAAFHYAAPTAFCSISSPFADVDTELQMAEDVYVLLINELHSGRFNSSATGALNINSRAKTVTGTVEADIAGSLPLLLSLSMDSKQFSFTGKENGKITTITPFVELFGLSHTIQRWITDYLHGNRYELQHVGGSFSWDDPLQILESFNAKVRVDGCQYTFAPGLEPIKTDYTDVSFQKGVLDIIPHASTFYGQDGQKSWLDINFNDPANILLTAYIRTEAVGNDDIMQLLEYYNIPLPFVQTEGTTETDLTLAVNLNQQQVQATGTFLIDEGIVEYETLPCPVKNVEVHLKNSTIRIKSLDLSIGELGHAGITGSVNVAAGVGNLVIDLYSLGIPLGDSNFKLDTSLVQPQLKYEIRPDGTRIVGDASYWKVADTTVQLDSFTSSFSFSDYSGTIPPTRVSVSGKTKDTYILATLGGTFWGRKKEVDLTGKLELFQVTGVELQDTDIPVRISYADGFHVETMETSRWEVAAIPLVLETTKIDYAENSLALAVKSLQLDDLFSAGVDGSYDPLGKKGAFQITAPSFANEQLGKLIGTEGFSLLIEQSAEAVQLGVPEFGLEGVQGENGHWSAQINDLAILHKRSPLLQRFKISTGTVSVAQGEESKLYTVKGSIPYDYPLLVAGTTPIDHYHIDGSLHQGFFQATINDAFHLYYREGLEIQADGILFNVPAIATFFDDCVKKEEEEQKKEESFTVSLTATDSGFFLSPNSQVVADSLTLYSSKNSIEIGLISGPGKIEIDMEGKQFLIQGDNLNDVFMNRLTPGAKLRNGRMRVAAQGTLDNFTTLLELENTVLLDFVTLNNILAFINTIPALITFNLPSYSSSGLHISSAVMGMEVVDGVARVESLQVESPELGITGQGWIDFPQKNIEMALNLITQSKKNVRKIPLVGYILAGGKKQPSITVKVSGQLEDPDVEHEVFKEVATIPFNILYRTLSLPSHIVSPLFGNEKSEKLESDSNENGNGQ